MGLLTVAVNHHVDVEKPRDAFYLGSKENCPSLCKLMASEMVNLDVGSSRIPPVVPSSFDENLSSTTM